jgi:two-component system chemotaxis response regulator CheB
VTALRRRDFVVIGASAGGIEALQAVLSKLPPRLDAAVLVALHRHPTAPSSLADLLARCSALPLEEGKDGQRIRRRTVYLAPQDRHMRVTANTLLIDRDPKQHHTRPAIDPLFISAAREHRTRVVGIILTGNLSDGVAGLLAVKRYGGVTLVQDPLEAQYSSMPRNALLYDHVDIVFPLRSLAAVVEQLVDGASLPEATAVAAMVT